VGLEVFEYNLRAQKAYEKIGFKVEGIQRQGLKRGNRHYDILIMGILKEDFARNL
jgi:RimJ/RimL family protein N-acetyltransferase